jgi:hypothetical protein
MADKWRTLREWPELILEQLEDAGVARVVLNRPDKRNCLNEPLVAAWFEALDIVRADRDIKVVVTKGAGICFSSGLDLHFLRKVSEEPRDWDRPTPTVQMAETLRGFPRIVIAQVHGYCLGGALGIMNCHDLVFAADDAQFGMPEILRASFGQLVTATLVHGGIPLKKVALMQLVGSNISGAEANRWGNYLPGAARCGAGSDRDIDCARNRVAPPSAARARQNHRADGPRPFAVASHPARSIGLRAHAPCDGPDCARELLPAIAEGWPEFGVQAAGCLAARPVGIAFMSDFSFASFANLLGCSDVDQPAWLERPQSPSELALRHPPNALHPASTVPRFVLRASIWERGSRPAPFAK